MSPVLAAEAKRSVPSAIFAGVRRRCPACGQATLFNGYLKIAHHCPSCGTEYHHHRADDAPPYFTILIVGHILVPLMVTAMQVTDWPGGVHTLIWVPLSLVLTLALLPRIKGALVALQWALRMHGFGDSAAQPR